MGRDAHAVIDEAQAASVYVFGGGIDEDVPLILVSADGAGSNGQECLPGMMLKSPAGQRMV